MTATVVDLFAGIGVGLALRGLGLEEHGIDIEPHVAETRERLGMATTCADITTLDPADWVGAEGLWSSQPCPDFSSAGKGLGIEGPTGRLIYEPVRWVEAIRPRWVAMEQVPGAEPFFREIARRLEVLGYRATVARMSAEEYGVPQTRERVYLIAHRDRRPRIPAPTHQPYAPGVPPERPTNLLGLLPWVSMAEAVGWPDGTTVDRRQTGAPVIPSPTLTSVAGGAGQWVVTTGANTSTAAGLRPYERPLDAPAPTVDTKAGSAWVMRHRRGAGMVERHGDRPSRPVTEPAFTLTAGQNRRVVVEHEGTGERIKLTTGHGCILMGFPEPDHVAANLPSAQRAAWSLIGNACCPPVVAPIVEELAS